MALKSGFYNALIVNGDYDRKYNADDYRNVFAAFIKDGVRRSGADDFKVSAQGLQLTINLGYAVCGGRWCRLDADYTISGISPPVGDFSRIDSVVLRVDENEATRAASIVYRTGTAASNPVAPSKDESTGINELILAHVIVEPSASSVVIEDTRPNADLCGWVTTPVGYDDYFSTMDSRFEEWFREKRDTLTSVTLYKRYLWRTVLESQAASVVFDIPQYDSTGVDIIEVYTNGIRETEGIDYTLNGSVVTFANGGGGTGTKVAGTEIVVLCYKSIDGTGLGSVSDEVTELQNKVASLGDVSAYNYFCNGATDNVKISEIVNNFLNESTTDNHMLTLRIYGTFGCTSAVAGAGTTDNRYQWIQAGGTAYTTRKVILDFENCSRIDITAPNNSHNVLFYGYNVYIKNARVNATVSGGSIIGTNGTGGKCVFERCLIAIAAGTLSYIAQRGEFDNCRFSVRCTAGAAYVFAPESFSFVRVNFGEFYAYAPAGYGAAVFYVPSGATNACVVSNGASCPTLAVSGYVQNYAIYDQSANGKCAYNNTVTALPISATGQNLTGTLAVSKADYT